jgi:hypothetical protein
MEMLKRCSQSGCIAAQPLWGLHGDQNAPIVAGYALAAPHFAYQWCRTCAAQFISELYVYVESPAVSCSALSRGYTAERCALRRLSLA